MFLLFGILGIQGNILGSFGLSGSKDRGILGWNEDVDPRAFGSHMLRLPGYRESLGFRSYWA